MKPSKNLILKVNHLKIFTNGIISKVMIPFIARSFARIYAKQP